MFEGVGRDFTKIQHDIIDMWRELGCCAFTGMEDWIGYGAFRGKLDHVNHIKDQYTEEAVEWIINVAKNLQWQCSNYGEGGATATTATSAVGAAATTTTAAALAATTTMVCSEGKSAKACDFCDLQSPGAGTRDAGIAKPQFVDRTS